jgi:aspartyl/asparaginyl-tRNA synthetase
MLEAEAAFIGMDEAMDIAEGCIKSCFESIVHQCPADVELLQARGAAAAAVGGGGGKQMPPNKKGKNASAPTTAPNTAPTADGHISIAASMAAPFARMTYTAAIDALLASSVQFRFAVEWGIDLAFEHEQWLAQEYCKGPVFVTDYPASFKPFYARANSDGKTVAAFDLLVPGIGELVGGSVREERHALLASKLAAEGLSEDLAWYLDLRQHGTVPHAGFGIGFERMLQYFNGVANIRDAIPFPRHAGSCRL